MMIDIFRSEFIQAGEEEVAPPITDEDGFDFFTPKTKPKPNNERYFDPDGKPTFLDAYLSHAAKNSGMQLYGLEVFSDQMQMMQAMEEDDSEFNFGSIQYEDIVQSYINGDLTDIMDDYESTGNMKRFDMINRNRIQANSFMELSKDQRLFAVVGAAHLFGKGSVIENLENAGYKVRRVNFGKKTDQLESLYQQIPTATKLTKSTRVISDQLTINAPVQIDLLHRTADMELWGAVDMGMGCLWADIVFPTYTDQETDLTDVMELYVPNPSILEEYGSVERGNIEMKEFRYNDNTMHAGYRLYRAEGMLVLQMLVTFATPTIKNLDQSLQFSKLKITPPKKNDQIEVSEKFGISYRFPIKKEFQINKSYYNFDTLAGFTHLALKHSFDSASRDEHLIQCTQLPSGYIYDNPNEFLQTIQESYLESLNAEVQKVDTVYSANTKGLIIEAQDKADPKVKMFLKFFARGNHQHLAMFYSRSGSRDDEFLNDFTLTDLNYGPAISHSIDELGLSISSPAPTVVAKEQYGTEEWMLLDSMYATSTVLTKLDFGPYTSYDYNQDSLATDKVKFSTKVDSTISFEPIYIDGTLMGCQTIYKQNEDALIYGELYLYYDQGGVQLMVYTPEIPKSVDYINDIFASIQVENAVSRNQKLRKNKDAIFLRDLNSRDTILQKEAETHAYGFEFDSTHLELLYTILEGKVHDEESTYSMKHSIIGHVVNLPFDLERIINIYHHQTNDATKRFILQNLITSGDEANINKAFHLLQSDHQNIGDLATYAFATFADSTELFIAHKDDLSSLIDQDINTSSIMSAYASQLEYTAEMTTYSADSTLLADYFGAYTSSEVDSLINDTTYYMAEAIFTYHSKYTDHPSYELLYDSIMARGTRYEKYRMIETTLKRNQAVDPQLLTEIINSPNYYQMTIDVYTKADKLAELPSKYVESNYNATMLARSHFTNFGYSVDHSSAQSISKETIDLDDKTVEVIFVQVGIQDSDKVMFGLIGPFEDQSYVEMNADLSVFHDKEVDQNQRENILKKLMKKFKDSHEPPED